MKRIVLLMVLVQAGWLCGCSSGESGSTEKDPWTAYEKILSEIEPPVFPDKQFNIIDYGAVPDGVSNCSLAFKEAIEACTLAGGGRVLVPRGDYHTGPIYLKSNVHLHLEEGVRILFSTEPNDYLPVVPTRWEGVELMNYSPLIYAYKEKNIAVTGSGILDGQASVQNWWSWNTNRPNSKEKGAPHQSAPGNRPALFLAGEKGVPVSERIFGEGHYLRPQFIQPYLCENVLLQDFTIINSPMWILHPVLCNNVTIKGVTVNSAGTNSDGCDPESCSNVLIDDCSFNTGDDCIALKSGRNEDGRRINRPVENIIVRNCKMKEGHGGVVIGSEISGGARNIFVEGCSMDSPNLTRAFRIKTNSARGGLIENVFIRNIEVGEVSESLLKINFYYEEGVGHGHTPQVDHVVLENITCKSTRFPLFLLGYEESKISGIRLKNVVVENAQEASIIRNVKDLIFEEVQFQLSREVDYWGSVKSIVE